MSTFATMQCPHCARPFGHFHGAFNDEGKVLDNPRPPEAGDCGFCPGCGGFAIFSEDGQPRLPTVAEQAGIDADPMAERVRDSWRRWTEQRKGAAQ